MPVFLLYSVNFLKSFSVRPFWKRCQRCCFYTKRLLLSDGLTSAAATEEGLCVFSSWGQIPLKRAKLRSTISHCGETLPPPPRQVWAAGFQTFCALSLKLYWFTFFNIINITIIFLFFFFFPRLSTATSLHPPFCVMSVFGHFLHPSTSICRSRWRSRARHQGCVHRYCVWQKVSRRLRPWHPPQSLPRGARHCSARSTHIDKHMHRRTHHSSTTNFDPHEYKLWVKQQQNEQKKATKYGRDTFPLQKAHKSCVLVTFYLFFCNRIFFLA